MAPPGLLRISAGAWTHLGEYPTRVGRLDVAGAFEGVGEVEVLKAAAGLARNRASGPDGLPVAVFRNLPALPPLVAQLLAASLLMGKIPWALRAFPLSLLAKPRRPRFLSHLSALSRSFGPRPNCLRWLSPTVYFHTRRGR